MFRRALLLLALVFIVTVAGNSAAVYSMQLAHRITAESIGKIRSGITLPEVEELLGAPPRNYSRGMAQAIIPYSGEAPWRAHPARNWVADDVSLLVYFDEEGRSSNHIQLSVHQSGECWLLRRLPFR
jgi:hypothetical protein